MKKLLKMAAIVLFAAFTMNLSAQSSSQVYKFTGDKNYKSDNNVTIDQAENQSEGLEQDWWQKASFYHIWIKSFADSNGDGCGDFNGIRNRLDYIKNSLGCDSIWLSPFFDCYGKSLEASINMHGYDTTDYYKVNDCFGTMEELEELIKACHAKGMKIIFDYVPNHTSPGHIWFQDFAARGKKKDWYVNSDKPLDWTTQMGCSGWFDIPWFETAKGVYFYGAFGQGMPDLNFRNYEVREEMKNVLRFWLNKGFDGVRMDAVRYLIEVPGRTEDTRESHQYFNELRTEVVDAYPVPKFMLCEAWVEYNRPVLESYFGSSAKPEFNMVFDFDAGHPCYTSAQFHFDKTEDTLRPNPDKKRTYATFLGSHDLYESRPGTRMKNDKRKIKQVTALSLMRPTVPFIYHGNELGAKNYDWSGDMALRGPFDWKDAENQKNDDKSVLNLNKVLLSLRKTYPETFAGGKIKKLTPKESTHYLAYTITGSDAAFLCVFNFADSSAENVTFKGISGFSSASCLIGDTDAPAPVFGKGSVVVKNLAACSYRIYLLDKECENLWDDEVYVSGENYTPANDTKMIHMPSKEMYLRGTMNNWGGTAMKRTVEGDTILWTCETFVNAGWCEYKVCINDSPNWGANWGNAEGRNCVFKSEGKKYRFTFNETTLELSCSAAE